MFEGFNYFLRTSSFLFFRRVGVGETSWIFSSDFYFSYVVAIIGGFTAISSFEDAVTGQNIITVTGEAEVFAAPDIASISFSVNIQKDTVEAAFSHSTSIRIRGKTNLCLIHFKQLNNM